MCVKREEEEEDEAEVRCELTQLTEKLRDNETTRGSLTSQLQTTDAAVRDGTKRVC